MNHQKSMYTKLFVHESAVCTMQTNNIETLSMTIIVIHIPNTPFQVGIFKIDTNKCYELLNSE